MTESPPRALAAIRFSWVNNPDDVWDPAPFHVPGLHPQAEREIEGGLRDALASSGSSPIGVALQGQKGAGKTHLLGWVRERTFSEGGYFFLVQLSSGSDFWQCVAQAVRDGLARRVDDKGETQLTTFLRRLAGAVWLRASVLSAFVGDGAPTREALDELVRSVRRHDPQVGQECGDTLRALALLASGDLTAESVALDHLGSTRESEGDERVRWRIRAEPRTPQNIVQDVSRLLALTGPTIIAIDRSTRCWTARPQRSATCARASGTASTTRSCGTSPVD